MFDEPHVHATEDNDLIAYYNKQLAEDPEAQIPKKYKIAIEK